MSNQGSSLISRIVKLLFARRLVTRYGLIESVYWPEYCEEMRTKFRVSAEQLRKAAVRTGSKKYIWRTSGDGEVCPECAKNEGKRFSWDAPPVGGHPGETACCSAGWCRCFAEPIV
jgi:Phage Mu protein F like protein